MSTVNSAQELAQRVNNRDPEITIEGDLGKKILKIKATGAAAWIIAFGAIGVAVTLAIAGTGTGPAMPAVESLAMTSAAGAVAIIGLPATVAAISMAIAVKDKKVLNILRDCYDVVSKTNNLVVLRKK